MINYYTDLKANAETKYLFKRNIRHNDTTNTTILIYFILPMWTCNKINDNIFTCMKLQLKCFHTKFVHEYLLHKI